MMNTIFYDEIINSSDLRKNQKRWFELAVNKPITINYGHRQLAIVNREDLGNLYSAVSYLQMILQVCDEFKEDNKSRTLIWANDLSDEDKTQFQKELLTTALRACVTNKWDAVGELLEDWKATAEVEIDPELAMVLTEEDNPGEYVSLEE
jgi:hypothetical protein